MTVPESAAAGWEPLPLPDWLNTAPEEREWILKNFLPYRAINLISGQQKWTQKTFLAMLMGLVVASGKSVGPFIPGNIRGKVLYILEEGDPSETRQRMLALCAGMGINPPSDFIFSHHGGIDLINDDWVEAIADRIETEGIVLTILDTLTSCKSCDENDAEEMKWVTDALQTFNVAGSSALVIAHLKKGAKDTEDLDLQPRGSGVIGQMRDNHLAIRNWKRTPYYDLTLLQRGGTERRYALGWDMINVETTDEDGDPVDELVRATPIIVQLTGRRVLKKQIAKLESGTAYDPRSLASALGLPIYIVTKLAKELVSEGLAERKGTSITIVGKDLDSH